VITLLAFFYSFRPLFFVPKAGFDRCLGETGLM